MSLLVDFIAFIWTNKDDLIWHGEEEASEGGEGSTVCLRLAAV
jgi:hypothetical protein